MVPLDAANTFQADTYPAYSMTYRESVDTNDFINSVPMVLKVNIVFGGLGAATEMH